MSGASTNTITRTYDDASRITQLSSSISTLSYSYDNGNLLSSESQNIASSGAGAKTISYAYDSDGNRATLTYPYGTTVTNGFTGRNQLASITADAPPPLATYTYDLNGNRTAKTLENNTSATYTYDDANRLTSLVHKQGTTPFASFNYAYDSVNRRTSKIVTNASVRSSESYAYDAIDQVTGVDYAVTNVVQRSVGYAYDALGNRTSVTNNGAPTTYTANSLNQYTAVGGTNLSYDGNGNLTSQSGWTYIYDAQNRLLSASNNTVTATFAYDARNRCVSRTINSTNTFLYYDGWNLIEERNSSDTELAHYIHGAAADEILVKVNGGAVYYHHDGLGNVTHLTDATDAVIEQYTYDVFGAATIRDGSGTLISATACGNRILFTGREYLAELVLHDYRNRMYAQALGRFLQTDPLRFDAGDIDLYRYVGNNPVNYTDPWGLKASGNDCDECNDSNGNPKQGSSVAKKCCASEAPMSSKAPNPYKRKDTYLLVHNRDMFEVGGDGSWGQIVRACLACMYKHGAGMHESHVFCYGNATDRTTRWQAASGRARAYSAGAFLEIYEAFSDSDDAY